MDTVRARRPRHLRGRAAVRGAAAGSGRGAVDWVDEPALRAPGGPGFWLVLRHAEVESVLDPATFSSSLGAHADPRPQDSGGAGLVRRMMLNMDPPDHARLRRMLTRSFTPRAVAALRTAITRGRAAGSSTG